MKKTIFFALLMIMSMSASTVFAGNLNPKNATENPAIPAKTDTKLTEAQATALKNRVEEIRDMDKSDMSAAEKLALRKEVKEIKQTAKKNGGYIYIGTGTLILIIILIIILV
jgi:type VI protein secretion system component VasF